MKRNNHIIPPSILQRVAGYRSHALWALLLLAVLVGVSMPARAVLTPTAPMQVDGVYQIGTANELWWFAQNAAANADAVLTANIDLGGSENGSFPGIGSSTKKYTGTFDGNGKTISGFYRATNTNVTGTGFFNYTNTGAVIKNFTLEGEVVLTSTSNIYAVGTVAGLPTGTTFEDITSSVTLTLINVPSGARIFGGLFGRITSCTVNRCRYNGTIDASGSTAFVDRLGGIAGDGNSTFNNCLFDGEIIVGATSNLKVAGILVAPNNPSTINNSLFAGKISFPAGAALSTNCGPIAGNGGNNITVNQSYYWTKGITKGGEQTSGYLTTRGTAIDTDTPDWATITSNLNTAEATNWMIKAGQDYPIPSKGHAHNYVNGICTNEDGCTQQLQPCTQAADGYYEIGNTGNLLWFGKGINDQSIAANSNARLTASINDRSMPLPEFSGIGTAVHPYAGIFDGAGHVITSTFTTAAGTGAVGMFAYLEGTAEKAATIKNLSLEGTFNVSAAREGIGALVGYMGDYTYINNVHSHVDINVTNADAKYIGGIIGIMEEKAVEQTRINIACYHNTLNVTASAGPVGGIVGDMRGGTIENDLFDGTIKTANTTTDLVIGGLVGQAYKASGNHKTAYIKSSLSYGTITATGATSTKLGSVMGRTNQIVSTSGGGDATYYKNNGVDNAFGVTDPSKTIETFTAVGTMTSAQLRTALGETNWAAGDPYPVPEAGGTHEHSYDEDGFCVANDGSYQAATQDGDYYIIDKAGKLYWFAQSINNGTIATNSKAKVTTNLDLNFNHWGMFPMIGNATHLYTGEFDGQGKTIANIQMFTTNIGATNRGMFIAASGAYIHDFTVNGLFYVAADPGNTHGGITGQTNGAKFEDINCAISIQCLTETSTTAEIGGFAGLANGGSVINRCRFSGTMVVSSGVASGDPAKTGDTHDAIGGMFGKTNNATITNCLFDGTITPASTHADLNVGGIIGYAESATTLKNSFSHGTITLSSGTYSNCGAVVGRGALAISDKLYYTGTLPASGSISAESFTNVTGNSTIYSASGLVYSLGDANWWLEAAAEGYYPVPKEGTHTHYYINGFCISEGSYEEPTEVDGVYNVVNAGNLFWLAQQMNLSTIGTGVNISLSNDVDMESKEFIGFKNFTGTFDGQTHTISGYARTNSTTDNSNGFGFFNKTTGATIKNLKIGGKLTITGGAANQSCYLGGLVGIADGTSFVDVTCSIGVETDNTIDGESSSKCIRIVGGMVGSMRGGSMNRCRYNGEMTLDASTDKVGDRFGGLVGWTQNTAATLDNCLFDGKIEAKKQSIIIGGIVGQGLSGSKILNSLATGTLKLTSVNTGCGMIIGNTNSATITNSHYTTTNFTEGGNAVTSTYNISGTLNDGTNWIALQNTLNGGVQTVDCNWKIVSGQAWPIPMAWENNHTHTWDENGFCVDGDGGYQSVNEPTGGIYLIANGGQLYDFVLKVNAGTIPYNSNAKLTADVNLADVEFPGIGTFVSVTDQSKAYTGTFDGDGHTISGLNMAVKSGSQKGFFNYAHNATIKNFTLAGTMTVSASGSSQQIASVVGLADGTTLIQDVTSTVDVNITSTAAQVAGFIGRAGASCTVDRCTYSGTVSSSTAYNKIGGFAGTIIGGTLKNCLFDGTLSLSSDNAGLIAGGLVSAFIDSNVGQIQNSLSNGTVTIPNHANGKCGIVVGLVDRNSTMSMTLYTTTGATNGLTAAVGSVTANYTLTGTAQNVTLGYSWADVNVMLNPYEGTIGNWSILTGDGAKEYPVPMLVNDYSHTHTYKNGFCISEDGNYEAATHATDSYYEVSNGGQLWWVATNINDGTLPKKTRIRLMNDINLEGNKHGSWPGICTLGKNGNQDDWEGTAFTGIFNGQGYTINNYYSQINAGLTRRGLFNAVYNATIKDFNINGSITVSGNQAEAVMIGAAVGGSSGTSVIEDINSSVTITVNNGIVRDLGGVAGGLGDQTNKASVTMNRCRYNGTITITGTQNKAAKNVGGVVGELRSAVMKNCLYDGTITVGSGVAYESIGGVVGKVGTNDNSEMHRILSHGTITLNGYAEATNKCGIVVGSADKTIYLYRCFHTTTNVTSGLSYIGPHTAIKSVKNEDTGVTESIPVEQLLGTSTDKTSSVADLKTDAFRTLMGEPNWTYVNSEYVYPFKDENHIHKYSNGFCTAGDGEYEKPNSMGTIYQIYNGGQLYWFATQFNDKKIPQNATVELMRDIDLESDNYIYPGIGTSDYRFKGTFAGHNYKIQRYYRDVVNAEGTGLINYAIGATIKEFSIYGETNFNLSGIKSYHGSVLGMGINGNTDENPADTMLISDVFSFVNINCSNANVRVLGGIAGRTSGGLKRSRYSGTIKGMGTEESDANYASASGRQIGGLIANAKEKILIEDCLFDGKIVVTCQEADTMRVSGILASNEKNCGVKITIKNCLFNGCLKLNHTYLQGRDGTGVKSTENGVIAGYWDSNLPKFVDNVYYLKTCDGMDNVNIGNWEGKNQQTGSTMTTTEIKPEGTDPDTGEKIVTKDQWNNIFKALDEYNEATGERNGNWLYEIDPTDPSSAEEHPVPGGHKCDHKLEDGSDAYDEFGYCTICNTPRPLVADDDGKFKMELVSDLASFRDMVNDGDLTEGTVLNAKLTADIDFSKFKDADGNYKDFGEPIGNSNFNRYLYNFDGQGYALLNVKIKTDDQYVGFFGFAGDDTHDCYIHDLTITGEIDVPYDSKKNNDKPMYMGVVGKMYRGKIENVHSQLTMKNTSPTRAMIGGILGCAETAGDQEVIISKCSYIGTCEANAVGSIGGIVGETSKNTKVENCTFAGTLYHKYTGENNTTQFGGIVGRNTEESFQGVKNCVVVGELNTKKAASEFKEYGIPGNHKNALVGEDEYMNSLAGSDLNTYKRKYSNNFALEAYVPLIPVNSQEKPTFYSRDHFISGRVCAELNARDHSLDLNYATYGLPFGQVLGYQTGENKDTLSTADAIPFPGYRNPDKKTYRVTKDASNNYTVDYYFFDDLGDTTPMPSDMASMAVKKIDYSRGGSASNAEYDMSGYNSFCLPFDFTNDMLPADAKCYTFKEVDGTDVKFSEISKWPIKAGTPFIMSCLDNTPKWCYNIDESFGTAVILKAGAFDDGASTVNNIPDAPGLYGVFNTKLIGPGFYKVKGDGSKLVKTNASSHCYPFRCYLKLPTSGGAKDYVPVFEDAASGIKAVTTSSEADGPRYNVMGQRVGKNAKGIVIVGGRKTLVVTK